MNTPKHTPPTSCGCTPILVTACLAAFAILTLAII